MYCASGITGQIVNYLWDSGSGGSSTPIFGVMGSLLVFIILHRKELLLPFLFIAGAGLLSSVAMIMSRDGHGAGLIIGALAASILPAAGWTFRDTASGQHRTNYPP